MLRLNYDIESFILKQNNITILYYSLWNLNLFFFFFFASSIIKNIVAFPFGFPAGFPVKLNHCITFGSTSSAYYLLKSIAISL